MSKYCFDCGCEVEIIDSNKKEMDDLPSLKIDYYNLPDCPKVWDLIGTGRTKGIFQLESNLGQSWAKRVLPRNISEMAALIAVIRPGVLKSKLDGKTLIQHYVDRKHGKEEVEYFHEALEPILKETYNILIYQEEAIRISTDIAGFNLQEADVLRKSIGHKDAKIMAQLKGKFLDGCKKTGIVTEEQAEEIFGWIQESQKYSFNASHSVGYGETGYWSAWVKYHFPFHFYTSWLYYAKHKIKPQLEMRQLITDAKYFNVDICTPSLPYLKYGDFGEFSLYQKRVRFGINNIKNMGLSRSLKLLKKVEECEGTLKKPIGEWTWYEILLYLDLTPRVMNSLVQTGTLLHLNIDRSRLLYEYKVWHKLTKKEKGILKKSNVNNIQDALKYLVNKGLAKNRQGKVKDLLDSLENPPQSLTDTMYKISNWELDLLGVPITYNKLDNCDQDRVSLANTTCKEVETLDPYKKIIIAGEINLVNEYKIKSGVNKGNLMAFLEVEDSTGTTSAVAFTEVFLENRHILYEGNTVLIFGKTSPKGGITIEKIKNL